LRRWLAVLCALLLDCDAKKPPTPATTPDAAPATDLRAWPAAAPEKRRAILLLHGAGGARIFTDTDHKKYPEAFAAHGYAVYMPDLGGERDGLEKARGALERVVKDPGVARVGVVGFSRGAWVGIRLAASDPRVMALVEFYGFLDDAERAAIARMPPTLIVHGERDRSVPVSQAKALELLLRAKDVDHEMKLYPDEGHGFDEPALGDSIQRALAFLDAHLHD
jgi:carboxymethylenebutenolidase